MLQEVYWEVVWLQFPDLQTRSKVYVALAHVYSQSLAQCTLFNNYTRFLHAAMNVYINNSQAIS